MKGTGKWTPKLLSLGAGLLIFLGVLVSQSFWEVGKPDIYRLLSDACIASAVLVGGIGLLVFASSEGTFDMLSFGFRQFINHFRPSARNERYIDFYEYKQSKGERKRPVAHMLLVGIFFFLLSLLFSFIWQRSM